MTIENKQWYYSQTLRLSLSGLSQEQISRELRVSEGTVNAILQDLIKSDDTLVIQREIAIVSKKNGIQVEQLASNLAFTNAIKLKAFETNKIESVLKAIDSYCVKDGILKPDDIGPLFIQFCDLVMKNKISPDNLNKELESKYNEHYKLVQQIEAQKANISQIKERSKSELQKYNVTANTLGDFLNFKEDLEGIGLDFDRREELLTVLYNIDEMDKDPKKIMDEVKKIRFLKLEKVRLIQECEKIEKALEYYRNEVDDVKRNNNLYIQAVDIIYNILQKGHDPKNILKIFDIYSKYPDLSPDQFAYDIATYGGIQGAIFKKYLDSIRIAPGT